MLSERNLSDLVLQIAALTASLCAFYSVGSCVRRGDGAILGDFGWASYCCTSRNATCQPILPHRSISLGGWVLTRHCLHTICIGELWFWLYRWPSFRFSRSEDCQKSRVLDFESDLPEVASGFHDAERIRDVRERKTLIDD